MLHAVLFRLRNRWERPLNTHNDSFDFVDKNNLFLSEQQIEVLRLAHLAALFFFGNRPKRQEIMQSVGELYDYCPPRRTSKILMIRAIPRFFISVIQVDRRLGNPPHQLRNTFIKPESETL